MHIVGSHSFAMCYCAVMKKSWKILVVLFGGMKCSSYLCTQMQDLRTKPIEGPRWAFLTTGVKGKQLSAPVLSYHRQGLHFDSSLKPSTQ